MGRLASSKGGRIEVELNKGAVGLGFCIEGGKGSPLGDRPITVKRLFKGKCTLQDDFLCLILLTYLYFYAKIAWTQDHLCTCNVMIRNVWMIIVFNETF